MEVGGLKPLEEIIYNYAMTSTGNPAFLGIIIMVFFTAFVMLQGGRNDQKVLFMAAGAMLASAFVDWLPVLLGLGGGFIIYLALVKATQR